MPNSRAITAWEGAFHCQYNTVVESLRGLLSRLRSGEIAPSAFGFFEVGAGARHGWIGFREEQYDEGTVFEIYKAGNGERTKDKLRIALGVFLVYEADIHTRVRLLCPLWQFQGSIDSTVKVAKHLADEARGHGVSVEAKRLPTDATRSLVVSANLGDLAAFLRRFRATRRGFGYWIEVPKEGLAGQSSALFFVLRTDGSLPVHGTFTGWDRNEAGLIECRQIGDITWVTICASSLEGRDRFWAFFNVLEHELAQLDVLRGSRDEESELDPLMEARSEVRGFKALVERQLYGDIKVDDKPQESIARALLQTYLIRRSYREVPVRGGRSDLLVFRKRGRFLYETKIWRGRNYYEQGLREIDEYIIGEGSDQELLGVFYLIFDATKSKRAEACIGGEFSTRTVRGQDVELVIISLLPPTPSSKLPDSP